MTEGHFLSNYEEALESGICILPIEFEICRQLSPELPQTRKNCFLAGFSPYLKSTFV